MKLRLGLPWRLGLILVIALLALWTFVVTVFYVGEGTVRAAALPTPGGLAALAKAVERIGAEDRALILTAMQTKSRSVRVAPGPFVQTPPPRLWPRDAATIEGYVLALEGRPLSVIPQPIVGPIATRFVSAFNKVEFQIGLRDGQVLIVRAGSPVAVAPSGVPVGVGSGLVGTLIALLALILLYREIRPLSHLAAALDRFDPEAPAPEAPRIRARSPEIRALTDAFARLQERLTTLTRARIALIGGVQHDLRTFATRLRLRVEKISDDEERARAEADIADMMALLDDALIAGRVSAAGLDEELFEPAAVIAAEVADRQSAGEPVDLSSSAAAQTALILGDRLALRRIVANLIDNAVRYGAEARLSLLVKADRIVLNIDDRGPGIPADQRQILFEPFTRLETSRARATGGSGLGLAIVKRLAEAQNGSVHVEDGPTGGARLVLELPIFRGA